MDFSVLKGVWRTVALLATCGSALAALAALAVGACIADLPGDQGPPSPAPPACRDGTINLDLGEECDPGPAAGDAGLAGCSADCRVECPSGYRWPGNNHCYRLATDTAGALQNDATDRCASFGGHVVTFASQAEFDAVTRHIDAGAFWVGLEPTRPPYGSATSYEPGWSLTCAGCYAHTSDAGAPLPRSDAGPDASPEDCVEGLGDPSVPAWLQYPCAGAPPIHVLCEREPVGHQSQGCEAGVCIDLVTTFRNKRYVYEAQPATADQARGVCQGLGGRLVVLGSRDEREQLWFQLSKVQGSPPPSAVWIGLALAPADDGGSGAPRWVWDDGTPADAPGAPPPPWGDREPRVAAGSTTRAYLEHFDTPPLDDTLARNDGPEGKLPFVCEVPASGP